MTLKPTPFEPLAVFSDRLRGTSQAVAYLDKHEARHLSNRVLHAHPAPSFWGEPTKDVWDDAAARDWPEAGVNLYLSIPFCLPTDPPHCGFCLFPTEDYAGKSAVQHYLDVLSAEAGLYRGVEETTRARLESLYVGGGTPNLLQDDDYARLIDIAERRFPGQLSGVEKTLEGIPQLFTRDKVAAIRQAGFNRVSMGVQQLNETLIRYSGRKQNNRQVFSAIESFVEHELAFNVDLIYAWPEQTMDDMLLDLSLAVSAGAQHITHYELNIAGRSHFAVQARELVPSVATKREMYLRAREYLLASGYVQRTVYDWEKRDSRQLPGGVVASAYQYETNLRATADPKDSGQAHYLCGLGHSAISIRSVASGDASNMVSYMNHRRLDRYESDVRAGRLPVERVYRHTPEDVRLVWLFQALQEMRVDAIQYRRVFAEDFTTAFGAEVNALVSRDWATMDAEVLCLTPTGSFHVPLIQALFARQRVEALTKAQRLAGIPVVTSQPTAKTCGA